MTYQDALDFLHIAENAYEAEAYSESAEIVRKIACFVIDKRNGLSGQQRAELTEAVKRSIGRFTFCPDEALWEDTCGLIDLFE
ncbi:MAG: hypothetical protein ACI3YB_04085 [Prevotella sp.]